MLLCKSGRLSVGSSKAVYYARVFQHGASHAVFEVSPRKSRGAVATRGYTVGLLAVMYSPKTHITESPPVTQLITRLGNFIHCDLHNQDRHDVFGGGEIDKSREGAPGHRNGPVPVMSLQPYPTTVQRHRYTPSVQQHHVGSLSWDIMQRSRVSFSSMAPKTANSQRPRNTRIQRQDHCFLSDRLADALSRTSPHNHTSREAITTQQPTYTPTCD